MYIFFVSPFDRLENISRPSLDKDISLKIAQRVTVAVGSWKRAFFSFSIFFSHASRFSPLVSPCDAFYPMNCRSGR